MKLSLLGGIATVAVALLFAGPSCSGSDEPRPLVKGLGFRYSNLVGPYEPTLDVSWSEIEPADGVLAHPNEIDRALAAGTPFRLRIQSGARAPDWLKTRVGTVTIKSSQNGRSYEVVRWWASGYETEYRQLLQLVASAYGRQPAFHSFAVCGAQAVYCEPMIRHLDSDATRGNLLAAGYTAAKDDAAQKAAIGDVDKVLGPYGIRAFEAFNPYEHLRSDGSWYVSTSEMRSYADYLRSRDPNAIVQNNSIRSSYIGEEASAESLYGTLLELPPPRSFQTATWNRIASAGDAATTAERQQALYDTIMWACQRLGAHYVELPTGYSFASEAEERAGDACLEGQP